MSKEMKSQTPIFDEYWRANYHDGVILSSAEWHRERLARAVKREIAAQLSVAQPNLDRTCQWKYMDFPESSSDFESECGGAWSFNEGGIEENEVKYCCRCGGRVLAPLPPVDDEEEAEDEETTER